MKVQVQVKLKVIIKNMWQYYSISVILNLIDYRFISINSRQKKLKFHEKDFQLRLSIQKIIV